MAPKTVRLRQLFDRESSTYTYLLYDTKALTAILIDPVDHNLERDISLISNLKLRLTHALNTHAHADHISATSLLRDRIPTVRTVMGFASGGRADILVRQDDTITLGDVYLRVIDTPGHTSGCVSYYVPDAGWVFTGDALLVRSCGRTDLQGGNAHVLYDSVRHHIFSLPEDTIVYPGHDYNGFTCSTIAEEKEHNPRLGGIITEDQFVDIMAGLKLKFPDLIGTAMPANLNCGVPLPRDK